MQEHYQELTLTMEAQFVDLIADFVANIFGDTLEIGKEHIIIRSENDLYYVQEAVQALAATLGDTVRIDYHLEVKRNIDWIKQYQDSVEPIEAAKFYIHPSWFAPKEGKINIKIDPALAFGSQDIMRRPSAVLR